jgi:hypothetical protein
MERRAGNVDTFPPTHCRKAAPRTRPRGRQKPAKTQRLQTSFGSGKQPSQAATAKQHRSKATELRGQETHEKASRQIPPSPSKGSPNSRAAFALPEAGGAGSGRVAPQVGAELRLR